MYRYLIEFKFIFEYMTFHESITHIPMAPAVETGERLKELGELNVLVHPFFIVHPFSVDRAYRERLDLMFKRSVEKFVPLAPNQVTLLMPDIENMETFFRQKHDNEFAKRLRPEHTNWTDLYRAIKRGTIFPSNVFLAPNIVPEKCGVEKLISRLERKGVSLSTKTLVTVGGEYLNNCVAIVVNKIMELQQISFLRVDKEASIPIRYGFCFEDSEGFSLEYFDITEDEQYYYVHKKERGLKNLE